MSPENKSNELKPVKPNKEKYGWHNQDSFDDLESGWMIEGGEEAYFEALKEWEEACNDKS